MLRYDEKPQNQFVSASKQDSLKRFALCGFCDKTQSRRADGPIKVAARDGA
mgnify:CR=1 FL=1